MGLEALAGKLCLNINAMVSAIACSSAIVIMYVYLSSQVPGHTTNPLLNVARHEQVSW